MENQTNAPQQENTSEINSEDILTSEEVIQPIKRSKWQYVLIQLAFLLGGILLFVVINFIFGFMKGN